MKDAYVGVLRQSNTEEPQLPSSAQNPNTESGTSSFITNPVQPVPGAAEAIDFRANNAEDDLSMKSGSALNKVKPEQFKAGEPKFARPYGSVPFNL